MIIGVTGGLATGTSTAARYIASCLKGYLVVADKLAHLLLKKGSPVYKRIVSAFGEDILDKKGAIDRKELAKKSFDSRKNLKKLCDIIHPAVISRIREGIKDRCSRCKFIIVDAPVLIESNFYKECDKVIVVTSSLQAQLERAGKHKNIKLKDALSRISFQMPLYRKLRYADYIIDNGGGLKDLKDKCRRVAKSLKIQKGGR